MHKRYQTQTRVDNWMSANAALLGSQWQPPGNGPVRAAPPPRQPASPAPPGRWELRAVRSRPDVDAPKRIRRTGSEGQARAEAGERDEGRARKNGHCQRIQFRR